MGRKHIENETTAEDLGLDGLAHPSDDHGLSLEDLSEAYAQLIDGGADPYQPEEIDEDEGEEDELDEQEEESGEVEVTPRSILESMLFVGSSNNEPLSGRLVAGLMRGVSPREIDELVRELNDAYDAEACPYHIVSAGAGYTMQLRPEFARLRDKFYGRVREAKLSQPAIDVLAKRCGGVVEGGESGAAMSHLGFGGLSAPCVALGDSAQAGLDGGTEVFVVGHGWLLRAR